MQDGLEAGEIIDVSKFPRMDDGSFLLPIFMDDVDYCVANTDEWIWSIGKHKLSGRIFAAKDARFYQNPNYDCLWLR